MSAIRTTAALLAALLLVALIAPPARGADSLSQICDRLGPYVVCVLKNDRPAGSGVIVKIKNDFYVFTLLQYCSAEGCTKIALADQKTFETVLHGSSKPHGIAVLKIREPKGLLKGAEPGKFDKIEIGQKVLALGLHDSATPVAAFGIVSALHYEKNVADPIGDYFRTDALVNETNYGGPLVNLDGEVIGICAPLDGSRGRSRGAELNKAVPIDRFVEIADGSGAPDAIAPRDLGLNFVTDLSAPLKAKYKIDKGAWLGQVGNPGAAAGLRPGDIVVEINGEKIQDAEDLVRILAKSKLGDSVKIKVLRSNDNKLETQTFTVGTVKKDPGAGASIDPEPTDAVAVAQAIEAEDLVRIAREALPRVATVGNNLSGFVIRQSGAESWLVTECASLGGGRSDGPGIGAEGKIRVRFPLEKPDKDGSEYIETEGEIMGRDEIRGIALIKIPRKNAPAPWPIDIQRRPALGSQLIVLGSICERDGLTTGGVASAACNLGPAALYPGYILTDALVDRENRGGPVFDASGLLVGMAVGGRSAINGMYTIVPLDELVAVADEIARKGSLERGYIGIDKLVRISDEDRLKHGIADQTGLLVAALKDKGPAARAGITEGAILVKFNGWAVYSVEQLQVLVAIAPIGSSVDAEIVVDGQRKTMRIYIEKDSR